MTEYICDMAEVDPGTWETEVREPIVRCRDCTNVEEEHHGAWGRVWHCEEFGNVEPDGFCAWAKRKVDA